MAKGDGSVTEVKRKDGRSYRPKHWKVRIDRGTDPMTRKRNRPLTKTVTGTKVEACRLRDQMRQEVLAGFHGEGGQTTFATFAWQWHEGREAAGKLSKTRLARVRGILTLLCGYLGDVRLSDITPQVVDGTIARIRRDKVAELGSYSNTTLDMVFKVLRQVLDKAVGYGLIPANPTARADAPRPDESERRSMDVEEARRLLAAIDRAEEEAYAHRDGIEFRRTLREDASRPRFLRGMSRISYAIAARIGLATGMRRGEVLGLTWGCANLEGGSLRVRQSVNVYGEVKEPKTKAGNRVIAIDGVTARHLGLWLERQREELAFLGLRQDAATPICCSDQGTFINPNHFGKWWRSFADGNGFPGLKFHELRHTQATQLIANGADVKEVQSRLGHSSSSLTMDLYAHALPENDRLAAETIGRLFSGPGDGPEDRRLRLVG